MGLGQLRGPSWVDGMPLHCPNQASILAWTDWGVGDGGHHSFVMKKVKGPAQTFSTIKDSGHLGHLAGKKGAANRMVDRPRFLLRCLLLHNVHVRRFRVVLAANEFRRANDGTGQLSLSAA